MKASAARLRRAERGGCGGRRAAARAVPDVNARASDMRDAVRRARRLAAPGDAVLLAPACSSYDMFRDYNERGDVFRAVVLEEVAA